MKIKLNDKYFVTSDRYNYILKERRLPNADHHFTKNEGKAKYVDLGYFNTLNHLVRYLIENEIKTSNIECFQTLNEKISEIESTIVSNLEKIIETR